jgi:hypothetical protein
VLGWLPAGVKTWISASNLVFNVFICGATFHAEVQTLGASHPLLSHVSTTARKMYILVYSTFCDHLLSSREIVHVSVSAASARSSGKSTLTSRDWSMRDVCGGNLTKFIPCLM